MLRNTAISPFSYFYALGNTPAVNLTQDVPPEQTKVDILLAGCGDARSILNTIYNERGFRTLDFTCCDIEPSILARNILLFSFLLEQQDEIPKAAIWDIYFQMMIRPSSSDCLQAQVASLLQHANSMQSWTRGPFGQIITFCNENTLRRVRETWKLYTDLGLNTIKSRCRQKEIESARERAKDAKEKFFGKGVTLSGLRSLAPASFMAIKELATLYDSFWTNGGLDPTAKDLSPNPTMFLSTDRVLTLHYGTDPLLGFHLAAGYVPLQSGSPLKNHYHPDGGLPRAVTAAQTEFFAWLDAFNRYPRDNIRIHCFAGDALAFGHTLQHVHTYAGQNTGNWHIDSWSFARLELDKKQYGCPSSNPTCFSIIDVSNLCDHLGTLNITVAFAPLLVKAAVSVLYTEFLVSSKAGPNQRMHDLLCGDLASVSLLLGLGNVEAWTNTTSTFDADEGITDAFVKNMNAGLENDNSQIRTRLCWRQLDQLTQDAGTLRFDPSELAALLWTIHRNMFRNEDVSSLMQNLTMHGADHMSNPYYNRASFVALLKFVRGQVVVRWPTVVEKLLEHLQTDRTSLTGMNSYQELCLHLHLQGLFSVDTLVKAPSDFMAIDAPERVRDVAKLPAVLSITVQVPQEAVRYISEVPLGQLGIPSLGCTVQNTTLGSRSFSNLFCVVQAGFGTVKASRTTDDIGLRSLEVEEAKADWSGHTPMVVSFHVPTWTLLQARVGTTIDVGFQVTPHAAVKHTQKLGPGLSLFSTKVENESCVFLSRYLPNTYGVYSVCASSSIKTDGSASVDQQGGSFRVELSNDKSRIEYLVAKVSFTGKPAEVLACKENAVKIDQVSPWQLSLVVGKQGALKIEFPRPVSSLRSRLRVARKSSYVEVLAPFMLPSDEDFPQMYMFPVSIPQGVSKTPICWHIPYVNLDKLPRLDTSVTSNLEWLSLHTSLMFSVQERGIRDANLGVNASSGSANPRVDFKDGLFSVYGHVSGVSGPGGVEAQKATVFGLHKEGAGGIHILIFVSSALLDLSNRTVVLDAAVLVLSHDLISAPLFQEAMRQLQQSRKLCLINVTGSELKAWKMILPAFAERCRSWQHKPKTCRYVKSGQIPPLSGLEDAATPLCSCGIGHVSKDFMSHTRIAKLDSLLQKYATRVAISPVFPVPYMEPKSRDVSCPNPSLTVSAGSVRQHQRENNENGCAVCGKKQAIAASGESKALLQCSRCRKVNYCSQVCQKKDWKDGHKSACVEVKQATK